MVWLAAAGGQRGPGTHHPGHRRPGRQQDTDGRHVLPARHGESESEHEALPHCAGPKIKSFLMLQ